ncbi:hypothetical protein [Nonomuraea sp. NPDC005650]|uniref:hypothetical protein n=1 Tax=Nonomuraea sp. NPDC005650 TaxID=3157045 RepID=UPI0033A1D309
MTTATAIRTWTITEQFANGSYVMQTDELAVGVTSEGRVYWANPDGWSHIVRDAYQDQREFKDEFRPNCWNHSDYYFHAQYAISAPCQYATKLNQYGLPAENCGAPSVEYRPDRLIVRYVCADHL